MAARKPGKLVYWLPAAAVICGLFAAFQILTSSKPDDFRFLVGHRPIASGVMVLTSASVRNIGFTDEYLIYSCKENYADAVTRMDSELRAQGFSSQTLSKDPNYRAWGRPDGYSVWCQPGRSRTRAEAMKSSDRSKAYVTVMTLKPIPDNWISHARYAIEPSDY